MARLALAVDLSARGRNAGPAGGCRSGRPRRLGCIRASLGGSRLRRRAMLRWSRGRGRHMRVRYSAVVTRRSSRFGSAPSSAAALAAGLLCSAERVGLPRRAGRRAASPRRAGGFGRSVLCVPIVRAFLRSSGADVIPARCSKSATTTHGYRENSQDGEPDFPHSLNLPLIPVTTQRMLVPHVSSTKIFWQRGSSGTRS